MTDITNITASQRILAHLREGRLVQGTWHDEDGGREVACILGAIAPKISDAIGCPANVMPQWLAVLTIPMFDGQLEADALAWAARFGQQMQRWHRLDEAAWDRVRESFCAACVADAERSAAAAFADAAFAAAAAHAFAAARAAADADAARADARDAQADALMDAIERAMEVARG